MEQVSTALSLGQPVVVYGKEGSGKTTLLKKIANSFDSTKFPDGIVYIDGEWGAIAQSGLDGVMQSIFEALFDSDPMTKPSLTTMRTYLGGVKCLFVLDHLNLNAEQWRRILDLIPSGALIWSMEDPPPSQLALEVPLGNLPPEFSMRLFMINYGISEPGGQAESILAICKELGYRPITISLFARWAQHSNTSISDAVEWFSSHPEANTNADENILIKVIANLKPHEQVLASLLAYPEGFSIDRDTLIQASGVPLNQAETSLQKLQDYGIAYTKENTTRIEPATRNIIRRILPTTEVQRGRLSETILNYLIAHRTSLDHLSAHLGNLLGILDYALQTGRQEMIEIVAGVISAPLVLGGKWDLWREAFQRISLSARLSGNNLLLGRALHEMGTHQAAVGNLSEALQYLTMARDIRLQNGDAVAAAYSQHNLDTLMGVQPPGSSPDIEPENPSSPRRSVSLLRKIWLPLLVVLGAFMAAVYFFRQSFAQLLLPTQTNVGMVGEKFENQIPVTGQTVTPSLTSSFTPAPANLPATPTYTQTPTVTDSPSPTHTSTETLTPSATPTSTQTPYPQPSGVIVFGSNMGGSGNMEIYQMDANGRSIKQMTDISGNDNRADVSIKGNQIAFIHGPSDSRDIYYSLGGTARYGPNSALADESNPKWSPNGNSFVYQTDADGDLEIYIFDITDLTQTRLTKNDDRDACPDWSPDGRWIAFDTDRDNNREIYIMDPTNTTRQNLTRHPSSDRCPVWSPDNRTIAFISDRSGEDEIWLMDAAGKNQHQLTYNAPITGGAAWSPDGYWLAFTVELNGQGEIFIISTDGAIARNLTNQSANDTYPVWVVQTNFNIPIEKPPQLVN